MGLINNTTQSQAAATEISYQFANITEGNNFLCGTGFVNPNNATWGFQWAQATSTAVNTNVLGNNATTFLLMRRI